MVSDTEIELFQSIYKYFRIIIIVGNGNATSDRNSAVCTHGKVINGYYKKYFHSFERPSGKLILRC